MNAKIQHLDELKRLPREGWFALGAIGNGFPSAIARKLMRTGMLERRPAKAGAARTYDYRMTDEGRQKLVGE